MIEEIISEIERFVVGKKDVIKMILVALLSEGHILLEGPPGVAKTLIAKTSAKTLGLSFSRIQMTPDTLPADILGAAIYDVKTGEFKVKKGPIFANVLLVDELNRAPPKTQSAFLEAMQERQVTIEGTSYPLERPFLVIATQIPYGSPGTYPLTEVQIDRFAYKIKVRFASPEEEMKILEKIDSIESGEVRQVADRNKILQAMEEVRKIYVSEAVRKYIVDMIFKLRNNHALIEGPSARGTIWLMKASRAYAFLNKRNYVIPDDVKAVAPHVLRHRIQLRKEMLEEINEEQIIEELLLATPVPKG